MSEELALTGIKAINLLNCDDFPEENLFMAEFYNGNEEGTTEVIKCFKDGYIFTLENKYAYTLIKSGDKELVFPNTSAELVGLINKSTPLSEKLEQETNEALKSSGIPDPFLKFEFKKKKLLLKAIQGTKPPTEYERSQIFEIIKRDGYYISWWVPFYENWLKQIEVNKQPDPIGRLHLAYLARHSGQFEKAIKLTNVVEFQRRYFECSNFILSALCTTRAATFLDIFQAHFDPQLLSVARLTANKAYANKQDSLISAVYQRLSSYERDMEQLEYKAKINEAYKNWSSWT